MDDRRVNRKDVTLLRFDLDGIGKKAFKFRLVDVELAFGARYDSVGEFEPVDALIVLRQKNERISVIESAPLNGTPHPVWRNPTGCAEDGDRRVFHHRLAIDGTVDRLVKRFEIA